MVIKMALTRIDTKTKKIHTTWYEQKDSSNEMPTNQYRVCQTNYYNEFA